MKTVKEILVWITGLFSSNKKESWRVVILCLAAGTTFWFLNALNKNYTTKINHPIFFVFDREETVVMEELPEKIEIDVSGQGWNLLRKTFWFNVQPINIPLNNPTQIDFIVGSSLVPFISEQVPELNLNYVVTDSIFIHIDRKVGKEMAVDIDSAAIQLQDGIRITSPISLNPDSVLFEGPSVIIDTLPAKVFVKLPESIIDEDFNEPLEIDYPEVDHLNYIPEQVNVSFETGSYVQENMIVPVSLINFPADSSFLLSNQQVLLRYRVSTEDAGKLTTGDFKVIVNFKNLVDSTLSPLVIKYPDYIDNLTVTPSILEVRHED